MIRLILSIALGVLPEIIFFSLFLIYTKDIKEKRFKLITLIFLAYIICIMIDKMKTLYYCLFIGLIYIILKILYKEKAQIIDVFVFSISYIYTFIISYVCSIFINDNVVNYFVLLCMNRILLFLPFIFKNKFNYIYRKYCSLWNRNYEKKQPIKSITLRNISLISLNSFIFLCNAVCLYILHLKR